MTYSNYVSQVWLPQNAPCARKLKAHVHMYVNLCNCIMSHGVPGAEKIQIILCIQVLSEMTVHILCSVDVIYGLTGLCNQTTFPITF